MLAAFDPNGFEIEFPNGFDALLPNGFDMFEPSGLLLLPNIGLLSEVLWIDSSLVSLAFWSCIVSTLSLASNRSLSSSLSLSSSILSSSSFLVAVLGISTFFLLLLLIEAAEDGIFDFVLFP